MCVAFVLKFCFVFERGVFLCRMCCVCVSVVCAFCVCVSWYVFCLYDMCV